MFNLFLVLTLFVSLKPLTALAGGDPYREFDDLLNQMQNSTVESCDKSYDAALGSGSKGFVEEVKDACNKEVEDFCEAYVSTNSDGPDTGEGRLLSAICQLHASLGANAAVNNGKPTPQCGKAYLVAKDSPSTGDVFAAAEDCNKDTARICNQSSTREGRGGDSRLVAASCDLVAEHGALQALTKLKK